MLIRIVQLPCDHVLYAVPSIGITVQLALIGLLKRITGMNDAMSMYSRLVQSDKVQHICVLLF